MATGSNSPGPQSYQSVVDACAKIIDDLEQLVAAYQGFLQPDDIDLVASVPVLGQKPFDRARLKIQSGLLNIAVCGGFSSGKSFLISALINHLGWYPLEDEFHSDRPRDGWSPFLPTSPEQTSSCPLAVLPASGVDDHPQLEVMFTDTKQWESKSEPYISDEDVKSKLLAYCTEVDQWRGTRATPDWPRDVLRARLYIPQLSLPAAIHDLPGIGGAGNRYQEVVLDAMRQADCILYVTSAIKELTEVELRLLELVMEIAQLNSSPVFFLVSQIDREPHYRRVLEKNNEFLKTFFQAERAALPRLGGSSFKPISPAVEAKARTQHEQGLISSEERDERINRSGMVSLRRDLQEYLSTSSGPTHLREIAVQMKNVLSSVMAHIDARQRVEAVPLAEAQRAIEVARERVERLRTSRDWLAAELDRLASLAIVSAFATSDVSELHALLRAGLEPLIRSFDVTKESMRHRIKQASDEIVRSWFARPRGGLQHTWNEAWNHYQKEGIDLLHVVIGEDDEDGSNDWVVGGLSIKDRSIGSYKPTKGSLASTINLVGTAWQTWLSLTGVGAAATGAVSAGAASTTTGLLATGVVATGTAIGGTAIALSPVGFFLIAAGTVGLGWSWRQRRRDRRRLREEMLEDLQVLANQTLTQQRSEAQRLLGAMRGQIIDIVTRAISSEMDGIRALEVRLKIGDLSEHAIRTELLRRIHDQCQEIDDQIEATYVSLARLARQAPR